MPDITNFDYVPVTDNSGLGDLGAGQPIISDVPQNPADTGLNAIAQSYDSLLKKQPIWDKQNILNQPYKSRLNDTLRYTDPDIGFNPFDKKLEYKYAAAHPFKTFGNNLLQFGARFLGAAVEAIATIPLALSGESLYDNDVTNSINEWLDDLNTELPTYRTEFEENNPILKYVSFWKPTSFFGAWGQAVNNLGYTAGAFAGTWGAMLPFTALGNAVKLTKMFGSFGRAVATDAATVGNQARGIVLAGERGLATTLRGEAAEAGAVARQGAANGRQLGADFMLAEGKGLPSQALPNIAKNIQASNVNSLDKSLTFLNGVAKVRDWTKYNLSLLTAATAEGSFEANHVMNDGREQLAQKFYEQYGRSPQGTELLELEGIAKDAADFTMGANVALLYFNNRILWGSLFKPGKVAQTEVIDGTFRNISKNTLQQNVKTGAYEVVKHTPETRLGKLLLNITKPGRFMAVNIGEAFEEASQFTISEGTLDYASRRFDAQSRGEVASYMKSFYTGLNKTFNTNEGWDNITGGFVGGMLGGAVRNRIEKSRGLTSSPLKRLQQQAELMNSVNITGLFEHKVQEAAVNNSLAKDYKRAVEEGDIFKANTLKHNMLFNYVSSAVKANRFDMRIDELEAAKELTGDEFKKMWGQNYTEATGQSAAEYLDSVIEKAKAIKKDVDRVQRLWQSNPFDVKKQPDDYVAYDSYKDELARNLGVSREFQARMKNVESDLKALLPGIDTQRALEITSLQGMRDMLTRLQTTMNELAKQESEVQDNEELAKGFRTKRHQIKALFDELQPQVLEGFNASKFVKTLEKLYKYYSGLDDTNNDLIQDRKQIGEANTLYLEATNSTQKTHDELADALEQLQDIRKLAAANFGTLRYYNYLQTDVGQRQFTDKIKELITANLDSLITDDNGRTLTPEEVENEVEEKVRFETGTPVDVEETTSEQRDNLRTAARKTVAGEELNEEEKALSEAKPKAYTNEVKIQDRTRKEVAKRTSPTVKVEPQGSQTEPTADNTFKGISPRNVFGLFSQDKNDVAFRTNLYNAIFKSGLNGVFKQLKATFKKPEVENVSYTWIPGTGLYRSTFTENVVITHNDNQVGILRPANSVWLDRNGERSVYDMTAEEYTRITGNNADTYTAFMAAIKGYQTQYNKMRDALQAQPDTIFTHADIEQFFGLSINVGNRVQHDDPRRDVLLKDLNYKPEGTALISFVETIGVNPQGKQISTKTDEPAIVNAAELTEQQLAELEAFIATNLKFLKANFNRYVVVLPINGKYVIGGLVAARNAETNADHRSLYFKTVKDVASGMYKDEEQLSEVIGSINEKFFIANSDRSVKQTFITTTFTIEGDLVLSIVNPTLKVYKQIVIGKNVVAGMQDYYALINKIQATVYNEQTKDAGFKKLEIVINEDSLKQQVPTDTQVEQLSEVEDRLKLATVADVFENYTIHFDPSIGEAAGTGTTQQAPAPLTDQQRANAMQDALAAAQNIKDPLYRDPFIADPVNGLKTVAQQAHSSESEAVGAMDIYGAKIVSIALLLYPNETLQNSTIDYVTPQKERIGKDYSQKRRDIDAIFQGGLTEAERRIKTVIASDPNIVRSPAKLMKFAQVTAAELNKYSDKVTTFNENFKLLKDIERQRIDNLTNTVTRPVFAKTKEGIKTIMEDLFALPTEQAAAVAEIYDLNATAWAKRTGKPKEQFFTTLGFKSNLTPDAGQQGFAPQFDYYNGVKEIVRYLGLEFKQTGANFGGYTKAGLVGKQLADRVGEVIKEKGLDKWVGAQWDQTHNVILFRNRYPQNPLFQGKKEGDLDKLIEKLGKNVKLERNPLFNNRSFWVINDAVSVEFAEFQGMLYLSFISTNKDSRNKGEATKALEAIVKSADEAGVTMQLTAKSLDRDAGLKLKPLLEFYKKQGFRTITGQYGFGTIAEIENHAINSPYASENMVDMVRLPKTQQITAKDVKTKKTPGDAGEFDGSWDVMYGDQVIGQMTYDREGKEWIDNNVKDYHSTSYKLWALGDNKAEAVQTFVDRYNDKNNLLYQKPINEVDITPTLASTDSKMEAMDAEDLAFADKYDSTDKSKGDERYTPSSTAEFLAHLVEQKSAYRDPSLLNQGALGAYNTITNVIYALTNPNISTPLHELAHAWEAKLTDNEKAEVLKWADTATWTRETSEKFARGFENYLAEGKAPVKGLQALFDKFAKWLTEVYKNLKAAFGDVQLNEPMRQVYARMLGENNIDATDAAPVIAPAPQTTEEVLNTPLTPAQAQDYGKISKIQQAYQDGYYQQAIADKTLTEAKVREIFKSAGLAENNVDRIMFNLSNTDLIEKLAADIPAGIDAQYLRSDLSKAIKDGRFAAAIENGTLDATKAKQILDYFGINQKPFQEAFEKVENPVVPQITTEQNTKQEDVFMTNAIGETTDVNLSAEVRHSEQRIAEFEKDIKEATEGIEEYTNLLNLEKAKIKVKPNTSTEDLEYYDKKITEFKQGLREDKRRLKLEQERLETYQGYVQDELARRSEGTASTETFTPLTPETNIDFQQGLDGEQHIVVIDNEGNVLTNPANEIDNTFETAAEAEAFIDEYNALHTPDQALAAEVTEPQVTDVYEPAQTEPVVIDRYVQYTELGETKYAKVVEDQGLITVLENNGVQFDKLTDKLQPASQQQYEATLPPRIEIPDVKYQIGDKVVYGQDEQVYTITGAETKRRPKYNTQTIGVNKKGEPLTYREESNTNVVDVFYHTAEGVDIAEAGITGKARLTPVQKVQQVRREHLHRHRVLTRIAERFQQLFPQIRYEIGYFDFEAPARFYKGVVQINVAYQNKLSDLSVKERRTREGDVFLRREVVAHEFMHPFVLALQSSNRLLYKSLINELHKTQPEVMAEVDALIAKGLYQEAERDNEALVVYLGREITKAFDKDGILDKDYVQSRKNSLMVRFFNWLQDIWDFITGRKKPVTLDEFIGRANSDVSNRKTDIRRGIEDFEELAKVYHKTHKSDIDKTITFIYNEVNGKQSGKGKKEPLGFDGFATKYNITDVVALGKLIDAVEDYVAAKPTGKFEFFSRTNENYGVEFDEADGKVKVYIDPELVQDMSSASILEQYGDRIIDNELAEEFKELVRRNFYQKGTRDGDNTISVKHINPFMRLQDVSDLLVSELGKDGNFQVNYTGEELTAIDELEAYMMLTDPEAKKIRERIVRKLEALKDTADRRLNTDTLKIQYNVLSKLNLDENDIDFVMKYIEQGTAAINQAWRKYNELREDLEDKANLTRAKLNRLNKELEVVKQLIGFYDDVSSIYNKYDDMFDESELSRFRKATVNIDRFRQGLSNMAAELATEWLYPYIEKNNEYLAKQGYTDPKYTVTREEFKNNLLYGTNKDVGFLTFQLGAMVTSRDPVNAAFANTISDSIHLNHVDINDKVSDYMEAYTAWLKRTGIGNNNEKAQIAYYEKHYMRKAKIWTAIGFDDIKNEPIYGYVEKSALHQDYFYDQIEDAVRKYKDSLPMPKTSDEWDDQLVKVDKYRKSIKSSYVNPAYAALQKDPYFKFIEKTYNEQNAKYGKDALQYGIVPQLYRSQSLRTALQKYTNAIKEGNLKQNINLISERVGDKLANLQEDQTAVNLDGTTYRILNKELTNLKDDDKVEKNLQVSIVDFIIDASRYSSLKEIQFNAENLRMLIEGNTKFNVVPRKIGAEDLIGEIRDRRSLAAAKVKAKELEALKAAGDPNFKQSDLDAVNAKIAKGIKPRSVWDKFLPKLKKGQTDKLNKQLSEMLNDVFYGESEYRSDAKIGKQTINLNKLGAALGMYTSISSMAFNRVAGLANINQGNTQMWIEAFGGRHYKLKDVAWATAHYAKNTINYMADLKNPIHSKDTQLALKYDAIQGEYDDEYGVKVSGNIMRRMLRPGSLFFMTKVGEHQIQMTGMLSLMHAYKVKTKKGESISLYDAYVKDTNGRYDLRPDVLFDQEEQLRFKRTLHGINRALNGNYNELHKGHLQRTWYGKQLLRFRKWMYEGFRSRWSTERIDYEKNTVEKGYLNYFLTDYLINGLAQREFNLIKRYKNLTPDGKYRVNKASAELGMFVLLTLVALSLRGDDDDELTEAEKAVLLYTLRLRGDMGTYHIEAPSEAAKMLDNPSASINVAKKVIDVLIQLKRPNEVYERDYGIYKEGDSKLEAKFKKIIPVLNKAEIDWDSYLKYYNLINKDVK